MAPKDFQNISDLLKKTLNDLFLDIGKQDYIDHMESFTKSDQYFVQNYVSEWKRFFSEPLSVESNYSLFDGSKKLNFKKYLEDKETSGPLLEQHLTGIKRVVDLFCTLPKTIELMDAPEEEIIEINTKSSENETPSLPNLNALNFSDMDLGSMMITIQTSLGNMDQSVIMGQMNELMSGINNPASIMHKIENNEDNNSLFGIVNKLSKQIVEKKSS